MFARKLRLEIVDAEEARPVPMDWLDQFFMRNFIGLSIFDEVLVTGIGQLETSLEVEPAEVQKRFEEWLRGRKMLAAAERLEVRPR